MLAYDPVFTDLDNELLESMNIGCPTENKASPFLLYCLLRPFSLPSHIGRSRDHANVNGSTVR